MMRLVSTVKLCKFGVSVASRVMKRHSFSSLAVRTSCHHRSPTFARLLSTGSPTWKEAPQPRGDKSEEAETIELDKWKSVMRSKAALEEKQAKTEEEASDDDDDDESMEGTGGDLKDSSSLDATRELVAMWRQAGKLVPQEITDEELQTLAELTTKSSRKKYLKYLAIREGHKRSRKEKQQQRKAERAERDGNAEEGDDPSGQELKNSFLLQFWSRSLDKLLGWRSVQAMVFGQPLVFDMSYDANMGKRELENTVSQLLEVEGWNRRAAEPFHLHYCNLQPDGAYMRELLKRYGSEAWERLLITSSDRQHVDVFPREQLVYLTADSPNVLRSFDHSKVYIIGAMVDRSIQSGLSLANAKRLKLATARLPLDEFLRWEVGAKNLTLDQMIRIMLTVKETGNWEEALKPVPQRKHDGFHRYQTQKETPRSSSERTFKNADRNLYRPQEPGFPVSHTQAEGPRANKNKSSASRERISFKNKMDGRKSAARSKLWWEDE